MKKMIFILILSVMIVTITSCKKDKTFQSSNVATLMVINAAVNVPAIKVKIDNNPSTWVSAANINYTLSRFYYPQKRMVPVSVVSASDTNTFLLTKPINFTANIYSLFIVGQAPVIDTLFKEETSIPYLPQDKILTDPADSLIYLRFINLSPNSSPLNIIIQGNTQNELSNLGFKSVGGFKGYAAKSVNTTYRFEIREASTNNLLFTYNFPANASSLRFKTLTLFIRGLQGTASGSAAFGVSAYLHN